LPDPVSALFVAEVKRAKVVMAAAQPRPDFRAESGRSWIRTTDLRLIRAAL
jgi:hypothetical protein